MKGIRAKIRRQIELLGIIISKDGVVKVEDLAGRFGCEALTIKRDMQALRSMGIPVHSKGKNGIVLEKNLTTEQTVELLENYFTVTVNEHSIDKATALLVKKLKHRAMPIVTILHQSVEKGLKTEIVYKKADPPEKKSYLLEPYMIFQSEKAWRLLARDNGTLKQFLLDRILDVNLTGKTFRKPSKKLLREIFETSFRSWLGDDRFKVVLEIKEPWASRLKPRQLMEVQKITEKKDGTIIFETIVNSLNEIASWIVSRGEGIIVLEPEELRERVISLANGVLKNYN